MATLVSFNFHGGNDHVTDGWPAPGAIFRPEFAQNNPVCYG